MFQNKPELQAFNQIREPVPQVGAGLPAAARTDWDGGLLQRVNGSQQPIADVAASGDETIISSDLTIIGNVISKGRVKLEGTIEGDMHCRSLVVGEQGSVTGVIVADEVMVYGRVAGTVRASRVNLFATAHVEGDIFHRGIGIEMGTHYDGRLKWADAPQDAQSTDASTESRRASPSILPSG